MPVAAAFVRIFAALLLSIPLIFASGYYLLAAAAENTVLDDEFVADSLQESGLYHRIYGEVFLREEFRDWTTSLLGGLEVTEDQKRRLLREVLPPPYVQRQTEGNVVEVTDYLQGRDAELDLFVDLSTPLERAGPTALAYLEQRIESLNSERVSDPQQLSTEITTFLRSVAEGQVPSAVPTGGTLSPEQRVEAYRQAIATLESRDSIPPQAMAALKAKEREILPEVRRNDFSSALGMAGRTLARPQIENAVNSLRQQTGPQGRLDLIGQLAANSDRTPGEVRRDAGIVRFLVQAGTGVAAQWTALGISLLCLALVGAIFIPFWKHVILWPSVLLLVFGLLLLITAFSASWDSQYWSAGLCNGAGNGTCVLSVDIGRNIASGVAAMFTGTALQIIAIGFVGIVTSLVVSRIVGRRAR